MSRNKYVLAIDQGTTGNTVALFNRQGEMVRKIYQEFKQYYPPNRAGWSMMPGRFGWGFATFWSE